MMRRSVVGLLLLVVAACGGSGGDGNDETVLALEIAGRQVVDGETVAACVGAPQVWTIYAEGLTGLEGVDTDPDANSWPWDLDLRGGNGWASRTPTFPAPGLYACELVGLDGSRVSRRLVWYTQAGPCP